METTSLSCGRTVFRSKRHPPSSVTTTSRQMLRESFSTSTCVPISTPGSERRRSWNFAPSAFVGPEDGHAAHRVNAQSSAQVPTTAARSLKWRDEFR